MGNNSEFFTPSLQKMIVPGKKVEKYIRDGSKHNCILHILAIIIDNGDEYVVYKTYNRSTGWNYKIDWVHSFYIWDKEGWLRETA